MKEVIVQLEKKVQTKQLKTLTTLHLQDKVNTSFRVTSKTTKFEVQKLLREGKILFYLCKVLGAWYPAYYTSLYTTMYTNIIYNQDL